MKTDAFNPPSTPLRKGINLIEASAGTGKTYTIAMLVLRLVVELDMPVDKILVVTFTKAATEELKARIRNRLADAKRALLNDTNADNNISAWLNQLDLPHIIIKQRLNTALLDIDRAGIFTIHGFCQRVLKEHALASGQLFDAELNEDISAIKQACADDFWRLMLQNRTPWEAAMLTKDFSTPEALLASIVSVPEHALVLPGNLDLDVSLTEFRQLADIAKYSIPDCSQRLQAVVSEKQLKSSVQKTFVTNIDLLTQWLNGNTPQFPGDEALSLLTYDSLYNGLNGTYFKDNKTQTSDERKTEFLVSLAINTQPFDNLVAKSKEIQIALRRNLLDVLRVELDKQLEQINAWSFDNLITHLANALNSDQAAKLIHELRYRFQAALIDEFQDTDNNQWHIFSSIFAADSHHLMLVGDPKQAIYKFRGADIYSYLAAQQQAQHRYTLASNWRSHPQLVAAVNQLFRKDNIFLLPDISFQPAQPALTEQDGNLTVGGKACNPMVLWQLPESESTNGYWSSGLAGQAIQAAVINEIVKLLNDDFRLRPMNRNILPQDIAILVRTNQQAKDFQEALRLASVPAVLNSTESVFFSEEASNLFTLLEAIAHPGEINLLRQALALRWFGFDGQAFYHLLNNESELDTILARFLSYYQSWQQKGILTMMQSLLKQEKITQALSKSPLAERHISNLQHILELLQQAAIDRHLGLHKTLSWLKTAITEAQGKATSAENQQLRLESDADAVTIITLHRAKGLEYPIVFCPYLWQSSRKVSSKNPLVQCHLPDENNKRNNRLIVDLGSGQIDHHLAQERFEEQAEDVRLAYVALTRAKVRCYVAWANVRTEDKANDSALAALLGISDKDFGEQQALLQKLAADNNEAFAYTLLDKSGQINSSFNQADTPTKLSAKKRQRPVYTDWQMSSYTALSALGLTETPELPLDKVGEIHSPSIGVFDVLPAGAQTGNVVHDLLENIPFADLAKRSDISAARDLACQRYGLALSQPERIDELLYNTVSTPLSLTSGSFCLKNIPENRYLKEMPFYLSMPAFNTRKLNDILLKQPTFQPLSHKQMRGFLTGFIDLICEVDGYFYVMDYKTNSLPDYGIESLTHAMREHNYGLQYWIYCVVLHRYLTHRLPGYHFSDHFGGVRYLFVRGMEPGIAMSGVFETSPDESILNALSSLFGK